MLHFTLWRGEILSCFGEQLQIRSERCKGVSGVGRSVFSILISALQYQQHIGFSVYSESLYIGMSVTFKIGLLLKVYYPIWLIAALKGRTLFFLKYLGCFLPLCFLCAWKRDWLVSVQFESPFSLQGKMFFLLVWFFLSESCYTS